MLFCSILISIHSARTRRKKEKKNKGVRKRLLLCHLFAMGIRLLSVSVSICPNLILGEKASCQGTQDGRQQVHVWSLLHAHIYTHQQPHTRNEETQPQHSNRADRITASYRQAHRHSVLVPPLPLPIYWQVRNERSLTSAGGSWDLLADMEVQPCQLFPILSWNSQIRLGIGNAWHTER